MLMRLVCSIAVFAGTLLLQVQIASAQLCQGSLGDPLAYINFGGGTSSGSPLTAATTTYQFITSACPNDGFYTVVNKTSSCFSNSWHTLNSDHTGNKDGYFMLVNASLQPSAFYVDTVRGLCSNTTFEFAAWVTNVMRPGACSGAGIQPNLTFTIEKTDGTVLQTYNSGYIPSQPTPTWQQFGFYFTTPAGGADVVLRIINNSRGGCGNDLALDDITFRPCGPDIITAIQGLPGLDESFCEGPAHGYIFNGTLLSGYTNPTLQWQQNINGSGWTDIAGEHAFTLQRDFPAGTVPGSYQYRLSAVEASNAANSACRTASKVMTISINPIPVTTATGNSPVCVGKDLVLTATGGVQYDWTGVGGFSSSGSPVTIPDAQPSHAGKYKVRVSSTFGCVKDDSVEITVNPSPTAIASAATAAICQGELVQLTASGGTQYQWTPATNLSSAIIADPVALPDDTTDFSVVVSNGVGCTDTAIVTVNVAEQPSADAGPDKWIMKGKTTQLEGKAGGQDVDISWTPITNIDNAGLPNPVVSPPLSIDYLLTVDSRLGCGTATDSMRVVVYYDILVPNAFSPNKDGVNDVWRIPALKAMKDFDVRIYNRYGQLIFQTRDNNKGWDGKFNGVDQPMGSYVYMIHVDNRVLKGTVTLLR
jgi:gliding motility-associated-like protein